MLKRTIVAGALVGAALGSGAAVSAAPGSDGVWIDGAAYTLVTGPPPAGAAHPLPLYVVSPVAAAHPLHAAASARQHGFGAHDHVLAAAARRSTFAGVCDLNLVVAGPKAVVGGNALARRTLTPAGPKPLLHAARLGGRMVRLTSASRIARARALGLAAVVDTHTVIACHVERR